MSHNNGALEKRVDVAEMARQVASATGLECVEADMGRVLSALLATTDPWEAVGLAMRPFNLVAEATKVLKAWGLVAFRDGQVRLTSAGKKLCRNRGLGPRLLHRCPACQGRGISLETFAGALARFEKLAAQRPSPLAEFDQAHVTPATTMARLAFMADRGDLAGRELIVLGDDDLMGLAAALTGLPQRVVVLEIDTRLTGFMERAAQAEGLALEVLPHDLAQPLPEGLAGSFHAFFTDPPDAPGGMRLFLSRGIEALRGTGGSGYFGLTMIESSLSRWRELQANLVQECGVVITDIVHDFNTYANWGYLLGSLRGDVEPFCRPPQRPWYRSSLYRVGLLPDSRPFPGPFRQEGLYISPESLLWTRAPIS